MVLAKESEQIEVEEAVRKHETLGEGDGNMPLSQFCCKICGKCCPKKYLKHGQAQKRLSWLRHHYQRKHPTEFKNWGRK